MLGAEATAAADMKAFWQASATADLYKEWPGGVAEGLLMKGGLFNEKPLR